MEDLNCQDIHTHIANEDVAGVLQWIEQFGEDALLVAGPTGLFPLEAAAQKYIERRYTATARNLFCTILSGLLDRDLFEGSADVRPTENGPTLFCLVVLTRDPGLIERMLPYAEDLTAGPRYGNTPLRVALECGGAIARLILNTGFLAQLSEENLRTQIDFLRSKPAVIYFFWHQIGRNDWELAEQLVSEDPDQIRDALAVIAADLSREQWGDLFYAATGADKPCLMVEVYGHMDDPGQSRWTLHYRRVRLRAAAIGGNIDEIQALLDDGYVLSVPGDHADEDAIWHQLDAFTEFHHAPIVNAIRAGHEQVAIFMLENGAAPRYWEQDGFDSYTRKSILWDALDRNMDALLLAMVERFDLFATDVCAGYRFGQEYLPLFTRLFEFLLTLDGDLQLRCGRVVGQALAMGRGREILARLFDQMALPEPLSRSIGTGFVQQCYHEMKFFGVRGKWTVQNLLADQREVLETIRRLPLSCNIDSDVVWGESVFGRRKARRFCMLAAMGFDPTTMLQRLAGEMIQNPQNTAHCLICAEAIAIGYGIYLGMAINFRDSFIRILAFDRAIEDPDVLIAAFSLIVEVAEQASLPAKQVTSCLERIRALVGKGAWNNEPASLESQSARQIIVNLDSDWRPLEPEMYTENDIDDVRYLLSDMDQLVILPLHHQGIQHISELMAIIYLDILDREDSSEEESSEEA